MDAKMSCLSLGWGVQSWTIAAMAALGAIERPSLIVHADTTWEKKETYSFAAKWGPWLSDHGLNVVTATPTGDEQEVLSENSRVPIPAFTLSSIGDRGQLRRQCTTNWKIRTVRREVRRYMRENNIPLVPGAVSQWLGISEDEFERANVSDVAYAVNRYPLLELGMTRADCEKWLTDNGLPVPVKSSCVFCPYQNLSEWRKMAEENGESWRQSVLVDETIRTKRSPWTTFLHPSRIPLLELTGCESTEETGINQECDSGYCFM